MAATEKKLKLQKLLKLFESGALDHLLEDDPGEAPRVGSASSGSCVGAPRVRKRFVPRVPPGGVALLVKDHLPAQKVPICSPAGKQFYEQGRLLHCAVPLSKKICLHMFVVYGFTNAGKDRAQREQNERLLAEVFSLAQQLGDVPVIICGDLNTETPRSQELSAALTSGRFHDWAVLTTEEDEEVPKTCFQAGSQGTKIDYIGNSRP